MVSLNTEREVFGFAIENPIRDPAKRRDKHADARMYILIGRGDSATESACLELAAGAEPLREWRRYYS